MSSLKSILSRSDKERSKSPTDSISLYSLTEGGIEINVPTGKETHNGEAIELSPSANKLELDGGAGVTTSANTFLSRRNSRIHWLDELDSLSPPLMNEG